MDIFYFHAHFIYDGEEYEERDHYGFIVAKDWNDAMAQVVDCYRDDLMSVELSCIGDIGMVSTDNKEIAEAFKKSYIKTHYGEDEE